MVINIAICDDDKLICSQIENALLSYTNSICLEVKLSVFYGGKSLLDYIEQGFPLDVLYLDIEMDQIDGIEVGRRLRKVLRNHEIEIIYISGHDHYDRQLFDVQPLHFVQTRGQTRKHAQTRGRFSCLSPFLNLHFIDPVNGEAGKP